MRETNLHRGSPLDAWLGAVALASALVNAFGQVLR